jgi:hypothetical protein
LNETPFVGKLEGNYLLHRLHVSDETGMKLILQTVNGKIWTDSPGIQQIGPFEKIIRKSCFG